MSEKCICCLYLGEIKFKAMKTTTHVCTRMSSLKEAAKEVEKEGICENKLSAKEAIQYKEVVDILISSPGIARRIQSLKETSNPLYEVIIRMDSKKLEKLCEILNNEAIQKT